MPTKRRKGKSSARGNAPLPSQPEVGPQTSAASTSLEEPAAAADATNTSSTDKPEQSTAPALLESPQGEGPRMVLTSDKRRDVYHCDYCHANISMEPRIRCAVCPDFDLCLDCFATTDHSAAIARLKAAAVAHDAIVGQDGSIHGSGISAAAANHDDTHGYRVADSTRYPLFPSSRGVVPSRPPSSVDSRSEPEDTEMGKVDTKYSAADNSNDVTPGESKSQESDTVVPKDVDSQNEEKTEVKAATDEDNIETDTESVLVIQNDPKSVWTAEEDLRLLEAIKTHGLGNWTEIAESVSGPGSVGKTAKRCMDRYIDDFLGRYGHIIPAYTIAEDDEETMEAADATVEGAEEASLANKRPVSERNLLRGTSSVSLSSSGGRNRKKAKVVPTTSLPGYANAWSEPYLPPVPGIQAGQDVGREQSARAEQAFVKAITQASTAEEVKQIHQEWKETRLNKPGGPTVLPPRPEDLPALAGSELAGYMPRRGDMDLECENAAEEILADMEFSSSDLPQDRLLKIQIIEIYNTKLDERERRKNFLLNRNLLNYRENQQADLKMPRDERDLVRRLRLFERLHTPEEHEQFVSDILKAKKLRKEIAKLQMYRRMGITSLDEAERFELDKNRRERLKLAQLQKDQGSIERADQDAVEATETESSALWKQYKSNDRSARRSGGRLDVDMHDAAVSGDGSPMKISADLSGGEVTANNESKIASVEHIDSARVAESVKVSPVGAGVATSQTAIGGDEDGFDITGAPGFQLLSNKEAVLCRKLHLLPNQYLDVKAAIIHESLKQGLLDNEGAGSNRRAMVKIDSKKKGDVVEFMVRAGWISPKLSATVSD